MILSVCLPFIILSSLVVLSRAALHLDILTELVSPEPSSEETEPLFIHDDWELSCKEALEKQSNLLLRTISASSYLPRLTGNWSSTAALVQYQARAAAYTIRDAGCARENVQQIITARLPSSLVQVRAVVWADEANPPFEDAALSYAIGKFGDACRVRRDNEAGALFAYGLGVVRIGGPVNGQNENDIPRWETFGARTIVLDLSSDEKVDIFLHVKCAERNVPQSRDVLVLRGITIASVRESLAHDSLGLPIAKARSFMVAEFDFDASHPLIG